MGWLFASGRIRASADDGGEAVGWVVVGRRSGRGDGDGAVATMDGIYVVGLCRWFVNGVCRRRCPHILGSA